MKPSHSNVWDTARKCSSRLEDAFVHLVSMRVEDNLKTWMNFWLVVGEHHRSWKEVRLCLRSSSRRKFNTQNGKNLQ